MTAQSNRVRVGSSHGGKYTYWQAPDRYVYQYDERRGEWVGWLCSLEAWERTFSKAAWMVTA